MKFFYVFALIICMIPDQAVCQNNTIISGIIKDSNNKPIPYVNVFLLNTTDGSMSEDDGSFSFKTSITGKHTLAASMVGYKKYTAEIDIMPGMNVLTDIVLSGEAVKMDDAIVTASSYGTDKGKGLVISRIDVLTTPGGATDIFQALKTMPGLTQVSESAQLYVRGGDPIESVTLINQSPVYHPYSYESSYGGIFSNLNQSSVKSIYFTSGGFSAKYGNALSGILDIETKNQPANSVTSIGLSLANASVTSDIVIDPERFGIYFDARYNFTGPIFWLNGGSDRMTAAPESKNLSGGAVYSYSKTGRLKLFTILSEDKQGVKVERAEYTGSFDGNTKNTFVNLQNTDILFEDVVIKSSIGFNKYSNLWQLGVLDLLKTEYVYSFRNDCEYMPRSGVRLLAGFEFENRRINYKGKIPKEDYDIKPGAEETNIDASLRQNRYGVYTELQAGNIFGFENVSATAGIRYDNFPALKVSWLDPRIGLAYKTSDKTTLRFGSGIFRQLPDPRLYHPVDGNPDLDPMQAIHFITSYEYLFDEQNTFRAEIYTKKYEKLPLENVLLNYDNGGYGTASGIDIIYKGNFPFGINGWISYGFINTKRLWMDYDAYTSSEYNVTHNLAVVLKYNLSEEFQVGITSKYASGKPYTPVESAIYHETSAVYEPVYAATNSGRFPEYRRIDIRLTYFGQLPGGYPLIVFLEAINIFNFENIFGYSYSEDYSSKEVIQSYFGRRMLVMGFTVTL